MSRMLTRAPRPTAAWHALEPAIPAPRITTFPGRTPATPDSRTPRPPLVACRHHDPTWIASQDELVCYLSVASQAFHNHPFYLSDAMLVQGGATLDVQNSFYFDVFFENCPGDTYSLSDLPVLCDLHDPVAGCMTAAHAPINFALGPPATPFLLEPHERSRVLLGYLHVRGFQRDR